MFIDITCDGYHDLQSVPRGGDESQERGECLVCCYLLLEGLDVFSIIRDMVKIKAY